MILGILALQPRSGYEIKAFVDSSTRFFWAASYGQIYPELRRLDDAGLVAGEDASEGDRKRVVYELTGAGRQTLQDWLSEPADVYELRDEGLLKIFFADRVSQGAVREQLRWRRQHSTETAERLREVESRVEDGDSRYLVLRLGIEHNEWIAAWCERAERDLGAAMARREAVG